MSVTNTLRHLLGWALRGRRLPPPRWASTARHMPRAWNCAIACFSSCLTLACWHRG